MGHCISKRSKDVILLPEEISLGDTVVFIPPIEQGRVIKVYDGDTITIATTLYDSTLYRFSVRLRGIDTPEIRTKDREEKIHALKVRNIMRNRLMNQIVTLSDVGYDKYGRILATVWLDNHNVCQWLIDSKMAVEYDGKTKRVPESWKEYFNSAKNTLE